MKNKENFSYNSNDPIVLKKIAMNNKEVSEKERNTRLNNYKLKKYNDIVDLQDQVNNYTDKIISIKDILNKEMPVCSAIDLDPNYRL